MLATTDTKASGRAPMRLRNEREHMQGKTRMAVIGLAATALVSLTAAVAAGEGDGIPVGEHQELRVEALVGADNSPSSCSSIRWVGGSDSPLDTNSSALAVHVCAGDYADAYSNASYDTSRPVGNVKNLSWDEKVRADGTHGAGAPRISVEFSDGSIAYLASSTCRHNLVNSGGTWQRADFTGFKTNCSFHVTSDDGARAPVDTVYAANGATSAWGVFAAANSGLSVKHIYMMWDEEGFYRGDRFALGANRMYNRGLHRAVDCKGIESIC